MVLVTTVEVKKYMLINRAIKAATEVRKLKQILMNPGKHNMACIAVSNIIHDSPVIIEQISHTNQIYGPGMNGLKDETAKQNITQVQVELDEVPPFILRLYCNLTCITNIMSPKNSSFLAAIILIIRYCFIMQLLNLQVHTILKVCDIMRNLYEMKGFLLRVMNMDPESDPLCPGPEKMKIHLNKNGQGNHIPEAERLIRNTKDNKISTLAVTPFKKPPTMLNVGLIPVTMFWGNAIAAEDDVPRTMVPDSIITGRHIIYKKHSHLAFGDYAPPKRY